MGRRRIFAGVGGAGGSGVNQSTAARPMQTTIPIAATILIMVFAVLPPSVGVGEGAVDGGGGAGVGVEAADPLMGWAA